MVEAILCDMDGTLVQSNWLHAEAWQKAFAPLGIHVELEDIRRQIGKGGDELIPVFVPWWKREIVEEPLDAYRKYLLKTEFISRIEPFPQVREFFVRLKAAGIRPALATSASKPELEIYKKIANIADLIDEESTADDAERSKPHPDIFTAALKKLGLPAHKTIALGDTPYDAEAAGKAGLRTIGVTTGGWSEKELLDAGCAEAYKDVAELLANFDRSALMR
jgi:HAD superfamily hydrolase (TIGR01509 family)